MVPKPGRRRAGAVLCAVSVAVAAAAMACSPASSSSQAAAGPGFASKPYMGWSSWSLTGGTKTSPYGGTWFNQRDVQAQSDAMKARLQSHGYTYINLDSGWTKGLDDFGLPLPDPAKFPDLKALAAHVHANGQRFGLYYEPGLPKEAVTRNTAVKGTSCHATDIAVQPLTS